MATRQGPWADTTDFISILNDVLGPIMRGPSSSHTAGAYRIGTVARSLLGETPSSARMTFHPDGSYAPTYQVCGVDRAFACALLEIPMTDERFHDALNLAADAGTDIRFDVRPFKDADHPNQVEIALEGESGRRLWATAKSVGGGAVLFSRLEDWPVEITGKSHELLVECRADAAQQVACLLQVPDSLQAGLTQETRDGRSLLCSRGADALPAALLAALEGIAGVERVWRVQPVFFVRRGDPIFTSAEEMIVAAERRAGSLGRTALEYECELLGFNEDQALEEMSRRLAVMERSVNAGLAEQNIRMQLLRPTARAIMEADDAGELPVGGLHARAAARAMAVMHINNSMGVVCAAPTGGSAGTIPGVLTSLQHQRSIGRPQMLLALFAAGAIGLIVARRATFAAEIAGCQVEIGAGGAMAAAAVVEACGGTPRQAADAAAIAFHNCIGLVCDPVHGACEIPCHTRNAVAASSAFTCADLIMGGYENPIPLDETIDAVLTVGQMMPRELRCTALGGIAVTPSALALRGR